MARRIQNAKTGGITSQDILCSLVQLKIHPLIATEVEKLVADKENLQLEELFTIVNGLVQARELTEVNKNFATKLVVGSTRTYESRRENNTDPADHGTCIFCDGDHQSNRCGSSATVDQKRQRVAESRACYLCLKVGHAARQCMGGLNACPRCKLGKHHPLLCRKDIEAPSRQNRSLPA